MSFVEDMVKSFRAGAAESPKQQGEPRISMLQWVYIAKDEADRKEKVEMAYAKQQKFMALLKNESKVVGGRVGPIDIGGSPESYGETLMIGSKEFVQERFLEFKELGVDDFVCKFHIGPDHADVIGSMERFAEHVLPLAGGGTEKIAVAG
jgi:alkanesulfonate monooxygenase SsuD/methylene tetrahydromethanopterin reductase-like flavin-dependent oxidoreductase (luciferase family)